MLLTTHMYTAVWSEKIYTMYDVVLRCIIYFRTKLGGLVYSRIFLEIVLGKLSTSKGKTNKIYHAKPTVREREREGEGVRSRRQPGQFSL